MTAFALFPAPLNAAGVASLAVSSANGLPGATTLLNLSLSTSSGAQPAASQWVISYPVQNVTAISLTASAAVTNAQKQLSCIAGATAGTLNCILIGLNQNVIPTGTIATIAVQISATPSSSSVPIGVSAVTFSDVDGNYVDLSPLPSGGSIALPVVTIQPSSLSCTPSSVNAPGSAACTVTLSAAAPAGGVTVNLSSSNSGVQVPASVTVSSGSTSQTFSATVGSIATNLSSVITATAGGASKTFTLSAVGPATLSTLACAHATVLPRQTVTCTVTLSKAVSSAFAVTLSSSSTALAVPASVSVPAGSSTATFTATARSSATRRSDDKFSVSAGESSAIFNQTATVTATAGGVKKAFAVTIESSAQLVSLACSPNTVIGPTHSSCTLNFSSPTPASGVPAVLTSESLNVTAPGAFTVPAGVKSVSVDIPVESVASPETAVLTAMVNGVVKTASLTVEASRSVPTIELQQPVTADTYLSTQPTLSLSGAAAPSTGAALTEVIWSNDRGGSGTAKGTTSWSIESVTLLPGENTVTIQTTDSLGKTGSASLLVTYDSGPAISTKAGIFRNGAFHLGDGTGSWEAPAQVAVAMFGVAGDVAVLGNWDGAGPLAVGVFRRGEWFLDFNRNGVWDGPSIDRYGSFGADGDVPVVGDWDGSGRSQIGVFRNGTWLLDVNGNLTWDAGFDWSRSFGATGDSPILGDWDGSGPTKIGVFRQGLWLLDLNGNGIWDGPSKDRTGTFGAQGDKPLIGDWTGKGTQKVGVYRGGTFYLDLDGDLQFDPAADKTAPFEGLAGDVPVVGDWVGDRVTRVGLFRGGIWMLDVDGDGRRDPITDRTTYLGQAGDQPITGEWVISPRPPGQ